MLYNYYKGWIDNMKVMVFCSSFSICIQDKKELLEQPIDNKCLKDVCEVYDVSNESNFFVMEYINSRLCRLFFALLRMNHWMNSEIRDLQYKKYLEDKKLASFFLAPLIRTKGLLEIKPINCNDDTLISIYLLKGKTPFKVDVYDGEIEVVQNYRYKCSRRKMKNNIINK